MATVDPASQLAALIRSQVATVRGIRPAGTSGAKPPRTQRSGKASPEREDLSSIMAARIRSIDADDPQRGRKALRMFLEVVVLSELGPNLANDPKFSAMLDQVEQQMQSAPELAQASRQAADYLLQTADAIPR